MHIEHINISAPENVIEELRVFYCNIFDLQVGFRPVFERRGFWLYADEKSIIHLTESDRHFRSQQPTYLDHVAFQLEGLQYFIKKLKQYNINFETDNVPEIGMTQLFFNDPAGNGLEANFVNKKV